MALAQQILLPSIIVVPFLIQPVILSSCLDYTGTNQFICLEGDFDFLRINWDVKFLDSTEGDIGAKCYLNCDLNTENCEDKVAQDKAQKCDFTGPVGSRSCTISSPKYEFKSPPENKVTCNFFDPKNLDAQGKPIEFKKCEGEVCEYHSRTFVPIAYSLSASPIAVTVGKLFNYPIAVKSSGLIPSAYTFNIISDPSVLIVDIKEGFTELLIYGQKGVFSPRMVYLVTKSTTLSSLATTDVDKNTCNDDIDCGYLVDNFKCISNKCWKQVDVRLTAGKASLPEFDIFGFLQIMILSTAVLFLARRK